MGFASQSEHAVHFGFPNASTVERITIRWPSGRVSDYRDQQARTMLDRRVTIVEGGDVSSTDDAKRSSSP